MSDYQCDGSFLKMPSAKVAEMAQTMIRLIEFKRIEARAKTFAWVREKLMKRSWWDRLWNTLNKNWNQPITEPTEQQIIAYCEDEGEFYGSNPLDQDANLYSRQYHVAHRLLRATQYAEEIYISTADLQAIS